MAKFAVERPFHFVTVLWGEAYTQCFLEYCVASFLSPGNLPALSTHQRSKFLIATTRADWDHMQSTVIFRELERYVEPVFLDIPSCPKDKSGCEHMGLGHKLACEMAFREKAYAMIIPPDCMISDGTVRRMQQHAARGIKLVWVAALRFAEEPFFAHLRAWGLIPNESRQTSGKPLVISGAEMVRAGINAMHSETLSYEWEASYFPFQPSAVWSRVPGENGIVLHCLSWAPFLLDFGAIKAHDTSALQNWTIDGDYVYKNLRSSRKVHVIQDSDEIFYASWSPLEDRPFTLEPRFTSRFNWLNWALKAHEFRSAFYSPIFDPLKRKVFFRPVRWHSNPINSRWRPVERRLFLELRVCLSYWFALPIALLAPVIFCRRFNRLWKAIRNGREIIKMRFGEFSLQDAKARRRALWRAYQACFFLLTGRVLLEPVESAERKPPPNPHHEHRSSPT